MDDISNRTLAILLVTAIVVSLGATVSTLNRLSTGASGRAISDMGDVQLIISSTVSIRLLNDSIDFGSGYVNDTCDITSGAVNNATLTAGATYDDTNADNCWLEAVETPTSLHIENDGNSNVTLKVLGPTNETFFTGTDSIAYDGSNPYALQFQARNYEADSCTSTGGNLLDSWIDFGGVNRTICTNFQYTGVDELAIDIRAIIPVDLPADTYQNTAIEFTARSS